MVIFNDNLCELRTRLISLGFATVDYTGYGYTFEHGSSCCEVSLADRVARITRPDEDYNRNNIYSPRNEIIELAWVRSDEDDPGAIIDSIKKLCENYMI